MADTELVRPDPGAPLKMALRIHEAEWRLLFKPSHWNAIVRYSLQQAGDFWIGAYLPLRFHSYARNAGIYTGKKRMGLPLVKTGRLRRHTESKSYAVAKANGSRAYVELVIPDTYIIKKNPKPDNYAKGVLNYSSNPVVATSLSRITQREIARMAEVFGLTMQQTIRQAGTKVAGKGPNAGQVRRVLTTAQRALTAPRPRSLAPTASRSI